MNFEEYLLSFLPSDRWKIYRAMSYTPLAGGKRIRSKIIMKSAEDIGVDQMEKIAVAVELFHSGTLIHDDLPEIDNADLRRGKPANHLVFGQGTAVLAGDGLFFLAFKILSEFPRIFPTFSEVAFDVLLGEAMDVEMEGLEDVKYDDIVEMYRKKTGALFGFSFCASALQSGDRRAEELRKLGEEFGIAFQILDDIKDVLSSEETLGKNVGKDVKKKTVVKILGTHESLRRADDIYRDVLKNLESLGMKALREYLIEIENVVKRI